MIHKRYLCDCAFTCRPPGVICCFSTEGAEYLVDGETDDANAPPPVALPGSGAPAAALPHIWQNLACKSFRKVHVLHCHCCKEKIDKVDGFRRHEWATEKLESSSPAAQEGELEAQLLAGSAHRHIPIHRSLSSVLG